MPIYSRESLQTDRLPWVEVDDFEFFHLGQGTAGAWMFLIMLSFLSYWLVRRLLKPVEEGVR